MTFVNPETRDAATRTRQLLSAVEALKNGDTQISCVGLLTQKEYDKYLQYRVALAPADALRRVIYPAVS